MITLNATDYIKEMLRNGATEEAVAAHFADILNQTFESYNKENRATALDEEIAHVVDQINLCLQHYCELYGDKNQSYENFTAENLTEAFKAKIHGSEKKEVPDKSEASAQEEKPKKVGHVMVKDNDTGKVVLDQDLTEENFDATYGDFLNQLFDLFSK